MELITIQEKHSIDFINLRKSIENENIIQIKNFISKDKKEVNKKLIEYFQKKQYVNYRMKFNQKKLNPENIFARNSTNHNFKILNFGKAKSIQDALPMFYDDLTENLFNEMFSFFEKINGQKLNRENYRSHLIQYTNDNFFELHKHSREKQMCGLILVLGEKSKDYVEGGTVFYSTSKPIQSISTKDVEEFGDLFIFRYDLPHEVLKVSAPKNSLGRVTAIMPHRSN